MLTRCVHCSGIRGFTSACPYIGVPLSDMTPSRRGFLLEDIARQHDEVSVFFHTRDAQEDSLTISGNTRRGRNTVYDWRRLVGRRHRRVESKSSVFSWGRAQERWSLSFSGVRQGKFDDLVLVIYAPWGLELWESRNISYAGSCEREDERRSTLNFYGKSREFDLELSWLSSILPKLSAVASHTVTLAWDHPLIVEHLERRHVDTSYKEVPLFERSPVCRSRLLAEMVRRFVCQDFCSSDSSVVCSDMAAARCGPYWNQHGPIQVITSKILLDCKPPRWSLRFRGIIEHRFAPLFLVVYAPWGLEVWARFDECRNLKGERLDLSFYGSVWESDMKKSFDVHIRPKLGVAAQYVITICWGDDVIQEVLRSSGEPRGCSQQVVLNTD